MSEHEGVKRILTSIISSIESEKNPLSLDHELEFRKFLALIEEGKYHSELGVFFKENPEVLNQCLRNTFDRIIDFVKREIDRVSKIKQTRTLTEDEKQYVKNELRPISPLKNSA